MKHYESEVVVMKVFSLFQVFSQEQAKLNDLYENRQVSLKKSISVFIPLSTAWFPLKNDNRKQNEAHLLCTQDANPL